MSTVNGTWRSGRCMVCIGVIDGADLQRRAPLRQRPSCRQPAGDSDCPVSGWPGRKDVAEWWYENGEFHGLVKGPYHRDWQGYSGKVFSDRDNSTNRLRVVG